MLDVDQKVNSLLSKFSQVIADVERQLRQNPDDILCRLLGFHVQTKAQENGTLSVFGMPCPWCAKISILDKRNRGSLYLDSRSWSRLYCAACARGKIGESVAYIFRDRSGLAFAHQDEFAEQLAIAAGVSEPVDAVIIRNHGEFSVDIPEEVNFVKKARDLGSMPSDVKKWIINSQIEFIKNRECERDNRERSIKDRENRALSHIMMRGIGCNAIKKSKLFIEIIDDAIKVILPTFDVKGDPIGYQWFDVNKSFQGKNNYRTCRTSDGSSAWPFGIDTLLCNKDDEVLMVCGFFDYLSALEAGFNCVLSPFGMGSLTKNVEHLESVVSGRVINILFDRTKDEIANAIRTAEAFRGVGAITNVIAWKRGKENLDFNDYLMFCKRRKIDAKVCLVELIGDGRVVLVKNATGGDLDGILLEAGLNDE